MPSRADARRAAEWGLRALVIAALALALWRSLRPEPESRAELATDERGLRSALHTATTVPGVTSVDARIDAVPSRTQRDWMRALRHAGISVSWHGSPAALAMDLERTRDPVPRVRVSLAGAPSSVVLTDSAGTLDSAHVTQAGTTIESPSVIGGLSVVGGRAAARLGPGEPRAPRAVLVLGRAGWEGKFVAAALQEAGWVVRARSTVAPGVVIRDPALFPLDTARYDAVVALDSTAGAMATELARYVRGGGGLVLAGDAPSLGALRGIAPARTGARQPGRILLDGDSVTRADLPVRPLQGLRADAVRIEGTPATPLVAIRRSALGRVAAIAYDESWRWRMLGGESGAAAHREWWSRTVSLVAPAAPAAPSSASNDAAPVASLVAALGPSQPPRTAGAERPRMPALPLALLGLVALALLAEVASRRFRGAR